MKALVYVCTLVSTPPNRYRRGETLDLVDFGDGIGFHSVWLFQFVIAGKLSQVDDSFAVLGVDYSAVTQLNKYVGVVVYPLFYP